MAARSLLEQKQIKSYFASALMKPGMTAKGGKLSDRF